MKKGFTLIEMLIVVLIIGILAAIALPQYQVARDKAKFATIKDAARVLKEANERYYLMYQKYTGEIDDLDVSLPYTSKTRYESSATYTKLRFDWGACFILPISYTYCTISSPDVGYFLFYDRQYQGRKACYSKVNDERAARLCRKETGKTEREGTSSTYDFYFY